MEALDIRVRASFNPAARAAAALNTTSDMSAQSIIRELKTQGSQTAPSPLLPPFPTEVKCGVFHYIFESLNRVRRQSVVVWSIHNMKSQ
eukprot:CAMPEP_0179985604 /NCGR_PEP_ID=MMETSP0984-20121128/1773_1 /TAXON_ID=483367 /ORGANISM="non described non described, Strain CCMP 2436" /LENGTH=88 /DNA_ID=CAMNT_0021904305 /DNA_START=273 /DNA_END=539 /DNA_ORIENTATION=+